MSDSHNKKNKIKSHNSVKKPLEFSLKPADHTKVWLCGGEK